MAPALMTRFDPPLRQRLLWRDPVTPETLISEDRGLMARTFGTVTLVAALLGCLTLAIHANPGRDYALAAAVVVIELVFSAVCFTVYRRLPMWFFHFGIVFGVLLICVSALGEARDSAGVLAVCLIWIVVLANLFFSPRAALVHTVFASAAYGLVLYVLDVPYWHNYAVAALFVLGTAGLVVGWLRARLERVAEQLSKEARTDTVTGLPNRRGFNQRCDLEVARALREETPLSLIVCDLDRFKQVNDKLGHDQGDVALRTAAQAIRSSVRAVDEAGRLGGEEFGIVLPGADEEEAMRVAERVRHLVRSAFNSQPVRVTISCGIATAGTGVWTRESLLGSADRALYEAKRRGRNRTVAATDDPDEAGYELAASSTK